jgi:hypothetical protein
VLWLCAIFFFPCYEEDEDQTKGESSLDLIQVTLKLHQVKTTLSVISQVMHLMDNPLLLREFVDVYSGTFKYTVYVSTPLEVSLLEVIPKQDVYK